MAKASRKRKMCVDRTSDNKIRHKDGTAWRAYDYKLAGMQAPIGSVSDRVYRDLDNCGLLEDFICVIEMYSSRGYSIKDICEILYSKFPTFINKRDFNDLTLARMCKEHSDIAMALSYGLNGDDIYNYKLRNRARKLALSATKMEEIKTYNEMYNRLLISEPVENTTEEDDDNKLGFDFRR